MLATQLSRPPLPLAICILRSRVATLFKSSFGVEGYSAVKPPSLPKAYLTISKLCVKLFKEMGENISIQDIDTAHRVPQRNNAGNPKPIVCRFVRRLVKESLMSHRKEISDVTPAAVGLPEGSSLSSARIYDHLSPRLQAVLFQAKKVKEELHYQYSWSKGPVICLRKDSTSRIIKLKSMADLDELKRKLAIEG